MQKQARSPNLPVPLYHGTSTLFLSGISEKGLAGTNPLADWRVLECAQVIQALVAEHLSHLDSLIARAESFKRMVEQSSGVWNFQHGDTYLSPSLSTAIRYAANKRYGSELLTYTLEFLQELLNRDIAGVRDDLYRRFPKVFGVLDLSVAPVLIRIDEVPRSWLLSENGGDPTSVLDTILEVHRNSPSDVELICQQDNLRLRHPIPACDLTIWLINVTRWNPFSPEYVLYPLSVSQ